MTMLLVAPELQVANVVMQKGGNDYARAAIQLPPAQDEEGCTRSSFFFTG